MDWVEANLGEPIDRKKSYEDVLRDGVILCKYVHLRKVGEHVYLLECWSNFHVILGLYHYIMKHELDSFRKHSFLMQNANDNTVFNS